MRFIGHTARDIRHALRAIRATPLTALTIVGTVALGLAAIAVVFTILNVLLFRIDQVPDITAMVTVERTRLADGTREPLSRSALESLRADTDVFVDAYGTVPEIDLHVNGRRMAATLVTGRFFEVVRVAPTMGRAIEAADDEVAGGHAVVVLSHKGWDRHFQRDPRIIGRTLLVNGAPFEVIGVTPEGFRGLEVDSPDLWAPLSQLGQFRPADRGRQDVDIEIVGRLRPTVSREAARAALAAWDTHRSARTQDDAATTITLAPRQGTVPQPIEAIAMFSPLFAAFGLVLLIGCANVANLLLAKGVARQRDIGVRLSLGASRGRIVRELLTESVLLALAAAFLGFLLSRLALEGSVSWAMRAMPVDIGDVNLSVPAADWRVAAFLVVAAMGATALFALLPALHATAIDPMRTLRGELANHTRSDRARHVLIGVQVFASALLLIGAAIFLRSALASARFDAGIRTADTVLIDLNGDAARETMVRAITSDPAVAGHAAVLPRLLAPLPMAFVDAGHGPTAMPFKSVSGSYFDVLDIPIVRGRGFTAWERHADPVVIVSESVARTLWPNGDGVGETLRLTPDAGVRQRGGLLTINPDATADHVLTEARTVTVVGVARDVRGFRFTDVKEAGLFLPTGLEVPRTSIVARVHGDPGLARQALIDRLTPIDPNLGAIITMRTVARLETFFLDVAFRVAFVLGGLALVLTVSGLFSVLSYLVEQRTREIGVRMALGATAGSVTRLMLAQTARPVAAGLVLGAALAATLTFAVLTTSVGALIAQIVQVTDPVAYIGSLGVIVAACLAAAWWPASRAARVDPMRALRQD